MKIKNWCRQWAWMVGIWAASVLALGFVSMRVSRHDDRCRVKILARHL